MKQKILAGMAATLLTAGVAIAAEPAKMMDTSLGKVWTDEKGMTLYVFDKDQAGKSNCNDKCAEVWPPFKAAEDAKAEGEWTVVDRTDGSKMWAYEGRPLYTYTKDQKPGDVTGDGVTDDFGTWHAEKEA
jgi:predicted lipoprotein with Yx(FWY)xxD motif